MVRLATLHCLLLMEWSPLLRQVVKTQNPLNGELSHGVVTPSFHEGV